MYPILGEIGPFLFKSLWLCVITGFVVANLLLIQIVLKTQLKLFFLRKNYFFFIISAIIFSRIAFILGSHDYYFNGGFFKSIWSMLSIWDQGFSFWGAVTGALAGFYYKSLKENENWLEWFDAISIPAIAGMFFGYIGAFFDGRNYGKPTDSFLGMYFENIEIPYASSIHPVQLYGAVLLLIFFIILTYLHFYKQFKAGVLFCITVCGYSIIRFTEEFFRGTDSTVTLGLRYQQWLSIIIFLISFIFLLNLYNLFESIKVKLKLKKFKK